jgi:hypothetical protein
MSTKLRQRFVKDYSLPINVFDDTLFEYYRNLYDFFPEKQYQELIGNVNANYNGNIEKWLDYCASVRDNAINEVTNSDAFKEFINCDLSKYQVDRKITIGEHSYYNAETNGCRFISVDLKKANFQALKYVGVINDEDYGSFIGKFGGDDYIKNSKYLRQVILGNMNPKRQIAVENYMMSLIKTIVDELVPIGFDYYSFNSDEIVYKQNCKEFLGDINIICGVIERSVKERFNFDVRAEYVEVTKLPIVNVNNSDVDAFVRKNLNTGEENLKKASTTFYPQIYKLWKGMDIEDNDLIFYANDQLAKFLKPLKLNM